MKSRRIVQAAVIGLYLCALLVVSAGCTAIKTANSNASKEAAPAPIIGREALRNTDRVLVAAHKADWRRHPENSLTAIQGVIDMGADIAELDIQRTKDGVLILMHDETVDRTTDGTGKVSELTWEDISKLRLKERQGGDGAALTDEKVPTLHEAMTLAKGKIMVNFDKAWADRDDIWNILVETGTTDHGIFKSTANNFEVQRWLDSKSPRPIYMQVLQDSNLQTLDALLSGAKPDVFEVNFGKLSDKVISDEVLSAIQASGAKIWMNTMFPSLIGGKKDNKATWEWAVGKGARIIQTDSPILLLSEIHEKAEEQQQAAK